MENNNNSEDFESLLKESSSIQKPLEIGEMVQAKVISIDNETVYLDLGTRENGLINRAEFLISGKMTISQGDTIEVFVARKKEDVYFCTRRMNNRAEPNQESKNEASLELVKDAYAMGVLVKGKITKSLKSGFEVMVMGQRAFCPISQIEMNYCDDPDKHLNKSYDFKIIEYEEEGRNIVLSRKEYLLAENQKLAQKRWLEIEEGETYPGTITAVKNYGVFVDIGAIEGLLHVSEISYDKNLDPATKFKTGDRLDVQILTLDREKQKVSLSIKSTLEDPWDSVVTDLSTGSELPGKIVNLKPYGAFVELFPGIQGLLHVSKLGAGKRIDHPKQVLKPGQTVNVRILEINTTERRISLTMEEIEADFSKDLKKLKSDQDKEFGGKGTMSSLFDDFGKK